MFGVLHHILCVFTNSHVMKPGSIFVVSENVRFNYKKTCLVGESTFVIHPLNIVKYLKSSIVFLESAEAKLLLSSEELYDNQTAQSAQNLGAKQQPEKIKKIVGLHAFNVFEMPGIILRKGKIVLYKGRKVKLLKNTRATLLSHCDKYESKITDIGQMFTCKNARVVLNEDCEGTADKRSDEIDGCLDGVKKIATRCQDVVLQREIVLIEKDTQVRTDLVIPVSHVEIFCTYTTDKHQFILVNKEVKYLFDFYNEPILETSI